jgi:hypothetical protein
MRRRPIIPQRRRIFLGCEGESERSYGALLNQVALEERNLHIALDLELLRPGGGDPLALVELACRLIERKESNHGLFRQKAILLDSDKLELSPIRDQTMFDLANREGIRLIFQRPTHEALILRHLDGRQQRRPQTAADALASVRREWPAYEKPMSAMRLAERLTDTHIVQACQVEPELRAFLIELGFLL